MLGFLLAAACLDQTPIDLQRLGLARNSFGKPANAPPQYTYTGSIEKGAVTLIFPVGVADRRYMVVETQDWRRYLTCQTKKGRRIILNWSIELHMIGKEPKSNFKGTLAKMLAGANFFLIAPPDVPNPVRHALTSQKGMAVYSFNPVIGWSYWFEENGAMSMVRSGPDAFQSVWPEMKGPYPITPEEKSRLTKSAKASIP